MTEQRQYVYERERPKRQQPPQRAKVLRFIRAHNEVAGCFPTKREIADYMGWKAEQSAYHVLQALASDGHIRRAGRERNGFKAIIWELAP